MFSTSIHAVRQEFGDTKGVIDIRILKRNREHNGQKKRQTKGQTPIYPNAMIEA